MKGFPENSRVVPIGSSSDELRGRRRQMSKVRGSGEEGAIIMLALAYLVVISLVVAMLSTWVSNDLNNSTKFSSSNSLTVAASGMTDMAIQYVRYNPIISNSQAVAPAVSPLVACWGGTNISQIPAIDGDQVAVWCTTSWNPLVAQTRTVTFYACPISVLAGACENSAFLTAIVIYDDYPPAPARSAPIQDLCTVFCGQGMTIQSWQWGSAAGGSATGVAATLSFTNEPSDTTAFASTQASVLVLDSGNNPVVDDTVTLVQQSGPSNGSVPGISTPTSVLTAYTNSSGVATFNSIYPQIAGNYTLTAVDGSAVATSTNFVVGWQRSVISPPPAPTSPTVNGTYTLTATATSGDSVTINDSTTSVCSLSGATLTFKTAGTCTVVFTDPATGSMVYSPALPVTLSFTVGGSAATQVGIALATSTPSESTTTNDQVTVTLENSVGAPVKNPGPTAISIVLSDVGNGSFSATSGGAASSTLTLNFGSGVGTQTAYFGSQTTGPDTVSAVNGTSIWGSAKLTVEVGTPDQVAITPSTNTPGVSSQTNTTLSLQLEDSGGNFSSSTTPTTLVLGDTGNGFFSTTSGGATGMSTISVTFPSGVGSETVYIGNETSGSDTVSALNGTTSWGTSVLNFAAGAATQVLITLNPTTVSVSAKTNITVNLQLADQFGNAVQTNGVSLTLTNSGHGYFGGGLNVAKPGKPSLTVTTGMNGSATGYFGDDTSESDTITATGGGLSSTTTPFNV